MNGILAIETATEACSVAFLRNDAVTECHEITPRQHNQHLFRMLRELLPAGGLREQGVEAIAYGCGPGSFTGLRIAASAVQGLAYAADLPAIPVSTLACQAQTALRRGLVADGETILSTLDARINEIYYAWYRVDEGLVAPLTPALACAPSQVTLPADCAAARGVGSGCEFLSQMPVSVQEALASVQADVLPQARDMFPLALAAAARGEMQTAQQVQPVYVRDEINWKKIAEQGKRA